MTLRRIPRLILLPYGDFQIKQFCWIIYRYPLPTHCTARLTTSAIITYFTYILAIGSKFFRHIQRFAINMAETQQPNVRPTNRVLSAMRINLTTLGSSPRRSTIREG